MSRVAHYLLVAVFGLMTLGGVTLAAPSPAELGFIEHEMTCAEWFEASDAMTGSVRLTDCALAPTAGRSETLDLAQLATRQAPSSGGTIEAAARIWPTAVPVLEPEASGRALVLVTHDPELRRLADTFSDSNRGNRGPAAPGSRERFRERHADELRRARTVEGTIEELSRSRHGNLVRPLGSYAPTFVIGPADTRRASRAPGIVLATFGGLALLFVVLAQRRWTRRRDELLGATDRPLTF